MKTIILDTNFLLAITELRLDVFTEIDRACDVPYQLCILDRTKEELETFIKGPSLSKRRASLMALQLLDKKRVQVLKTQGSQHVDDILATQKNAIIATVDRALRKRLQAQKIPVLTIRQKKYIVRE